MVGLDIQNKINKGFKGDFKNHRIFVDFEGLFLDDIFSGIFTQF